MKNKLITAREVDKLYKRLDLPLAGGQPEPRKINTGSLSYKLRPSQPRGLYR